MAFGVARPPHVEGDCSICAIPLLEPMGDAPFAADRIAQAYHLTIEGFVRDMGGPARPLPSVGHRRPEGAPDGPFEHLCHITCLFEAFSRNALCPTCRHEAPADWRIHLISLTYPPGLLVRVALNAIEGGNEEVLQASLQLINIHIAAFTPEQAKDLLLGIVRHLSEVRSRTIWFQFPDDAASQLICQMIAPILSTHGPEILDDVLLPPIDTRFALLPAQSLIRRSLGLIFPGDLFRLTTLPWLDRASPQLIHTVLAAVSALPRYPVAAPVPTVDPFPFIRNVMGLPQFNAIPRAEMGEFFLSICRQYPEIIPNLLADARFNTLPRETLLQSFLHCPRRLLGAFFPLLPPLTLAEHLHLITGLIPRDPILEAVDLRLVENFPPFDLPLIFSELETPQLVGLLQRVVSIGSRHLFRHFLRAIPLRQLPTLFYHCNRATRLAICQAYALPLAIASLTTLSGIALGITFGRRH